MGYASTADNRQDSRTSAESQWQPFEIADHSPPSGSKGKYTYNISIKVTYCNRKRIAGGCCVFAGSFAFKRNIDSSAKDAIGEFIRKRIG
jgi:hypothetical protein